jgi:hypothetical protein
MTWTEKGRTFIANGALEAHRRVKLSAGSTTIPHQVEYATAGEYGVGVTLYAAASGEAVAVKLFNDGGSFEIEANGAITKGASLYGTANGRVDDSGTGTVQFAAMEAASGAGAVIECLINPFLATTAGSVSVTDADSLFTATDVEEALAEIMTGIKTAQYTIQPTSLRLENGEAIPVFADGAADGWTQLSSKTMALRWNNGGTPGDMAAVFVLPQDLDDDADVVVHLLGAIVKAGANEVDSPVFTVEAYFDVDGAAPGADTNCGGESGEFLTAAEAALQEKTLTIAAADVPAAPTVLTLIFHPKDGQLGTDDFVLLPPWLEVTRKCLTS